jgi:hypothetical protein
MAIPYLGQGERVESGATGVPEDPMGSAERQTDSWPQDPAQAEKKGGRNCAPSTGIRTEGWLTRKDVGRRHAGEGTGDTEGAQYH